MHREMNKLGLLRAHSRMSQAAFASAMGVPFRTYQDLETGKSALREVHLQAARMALIQLAAVHPDEGYIPMSLQAFIETTLAQHVKAMKDDSGT